MRKFVLALALLAPGHVLAQGNLVLYCAPQEEWCRAMVTAFERKTGVKVAMTRKSSGEIYAQVKAEASNPRGDIWWGGTGDPHLQAAERSEERRVGKECRSRGSAWHVDIKAAMYVIDVAIDAIVL